MQPSIFRSNFTKTSTTAEIVLPALAARNIAFNTNNYMTDENLTIASRSNEVVTNNDSTTRNFKLRVNLSTINDVNSDLVATSPLIDYDISNMLVYEFKINNDDTNEKTFRGNATSKYISRTVELKDGLDAEDLKVFLTAYRPSSSEIGVYARFQSQFDNRPFNEIEWTKLEIKPETDLRSASSNRWDFVELEYSLPTAEPNPASGGGAWLDLTSNTIRYTDENGAEYSDYKLFAIKIVLLSPNIYAVPRLKDLRALALS